MAIVIANMIGAGVFTSLGYQLVDTTNTWSIILLWALGAVLAICGAISYAELGTQLIRSGGEYHFLSKIYHPLLGYLSGWVSLTVGFAAPVALSAMAIGAYLIHWIPIPPVLTSSAIVLLVTLMHSQTIQRSSLFQNWTTGLKVLLLLGFILLGFVLPTSESAFDWSNSWQQEILLPSFAVSFVYVTFSYSGWNAAAYIVGEIKDVQKNLPRALLMGTLIVSVLYILLNLVFLRHSGLQQLAGTLEIGQVVAQNMIGSWGGGIFSLLFVLLLVSSVSAMVWIGPRVTQVMAEDYPLWRYFSHKNAAEIPVRAIILQGLITLFLIVTGTFEQVLIYSGFILQLFAALAVGGIFILRKRKESTTHYKSPFFPIPQIIFLGLSLWVLIYLLWVQPLESGIGLVNLMIGALTYWWNKKSKRI